MIVGNEVQEMKPIKEEEIKASLLMAIKVRVW